MTKKILLDEITDEYAKQSFSRNEAGDGEIYAQQNKRHVLWCADRETMYTFRGHSWQEDQTKIAETLCEAVAIAYEKIMPSIDEDEDLWKIYKRRINRLRSVAGRKNTIEMGKTARDSKSGELLMTVTSDVFDSDTTKIACPTGIIHLKNGQLRDGKPEDYTTLAIPTPFHDIDEPCPAWEHCMEQIFPDSEVRNYYQKVVGSAFLGQRLEHYAYVLLGSGRNGKSAMNEELRRVLGSVICTSVPASLFMEQRFQSTGPTPELMELSTARFVFVSELPSKGLLDTPKIKLTTGGDTISARYGYSKKQSTFQPRCTLFLSCNSVPHCSGDDVTGMNRLRIITFPSTVVMDREPNPEKNEIAYDPNLEKKFAAERSGILSWIVRGCLLYQLEGLTPPQTVIDHTNEYKESEDVIGMWLADRQDPARSGWTAAAMLFDDFTTWCETTKTCRPWGSKTFYSDLKKRVKYAPQAKFKAYDIVLLPVINLSLVTD